MLAIGTISDEGRFSQVPTFTIAIVNDEFNSCEEQECKDIMAARERAVGATLTIAAEQVKAGKPYFGAVVTVSQEGEEIASFVVSAGATKLQDDP